MNKVNGMAVECTMDYSKKFIKGVITGFPVNVSAEDVKENITNVCVREVKRLKVNRTASVCDSFSVLISFDDVELLLKGLRWIYVLCGEALYTPLLRWFKCQRFGHVAAVCKGTQRCGKCSGEHEYGKCECERLLWETVRDIVNEESP